MSDDGADSPTPTTTTTTTTTTATPPPTNTNNKGKGPATTTTTTSNNKNSNGVNKGSKKKKKKLNKKPKRKRMPEPLAGPPMKSRRVARIVTSRFHTITAEIDRVKSDSSIEEAAKEERLKELEQQLEDIGGRQAYQDASILSTKLNHSTGKYVFSKLTELGRRPAKGEPKLKTLEVGAINTQILSCNWLETRAIDINSRHRLIEQINFFELEPAGEYDVIVCSMVINCVPEAHQRGKMLLNMYRHLKRGGVLFLMLPRHCLHRSKFMTWKLFNEAIVDIGFKIIETKESPKIAYFCLEVNEDDSPTEPLTPTRELLMYPHKIHKGRKYTSSFSVSF